MINSKINKEQFILDIKKDLNITSYEEIRKQDEIKQQKFKEKYGENIDEFSDLENIFYNSFKNTIMNNHEDNNKNNIYIACKISKTEAKQGCNKQISFKQINFLKESNNLKTEFKKIQVKIPSGIQRNQSLLIRGEGNYNPKIDKERGNLYIKIDIK